MTSRRRLLLCAIGLFVVIALAFVALKAPPDGLERGQLRQFLGRFHPLVVHLPIALVLLVAALECAGLFRAGKHLQASSNFVLTLAAVTALIAASLGWLLARSGGYEGSLVMRHMWGGLSLVGALILCCAVREWNSKFYGTLLFATVCLMVWTSDQGGKLTHGDGFLTEYMPAKLRALLGVPPPEKKRAPTASEGVLSPIKASPSGKVSVTFFASRVAPIFDDKCVQCHGPHKKKAKLRLDTFENVMRGGKDGAIVKPGDPHGSEIVRRIALPRDNKDAMPAEGKPGLTEAEIKVIEVWIASGASQDLAAAEVHGAPPLPPPEPASPPLAADYRPRSDKIQALQDELGVRLVPRSQNPTDGLILRTASARERCDDAALAKLAPVASLIVDAELAHTNVTDAGLKTLSTFSNLRSLDLSHTAITSVGVRLLSRLDKLEALNLTATGVDDIGVAPLRHKPRLKRLYLFETKCTIGQQK
jgi:uncharacterized membrane protein/mono/diheme cytochrome c family protein